MGRFIALPVGQGDAFYLEKKGFNVLVDGGRSKNNISGLVNRYCQIEILDILVCTHNDADHANGVIGLLEQWGGQIKEIWLPASWTYRIKDLLTSPKEFYKELVDNLNDSNAKTIDRDIKLDDNGGINIDEIMSELLDIDINEIILKGCNFNSFRRYFNMGNKIKEIVTLAYNRKCKIRFFEFGQNISGGEKGKLEPVNSREIISWKTKKISALQYINLTIENRGSLVFYSPENNVEPAVLFTADSDLNFALPNISPQKTAIITSPHHGSESNANVYGTVQKWVSKLNIWVRSDCRCKSRPGQTFKNQTNKYCTICNLGNNSFILRNIVEFSVSNGVWSPSASLRKCICK